jgi:hypothetical protein
MISEGKITAEEGSRLLAALKDPERRGAGSQTGSGPLSSEARFLRIRVTSNDTGRERVSVNIPMNLVNVALRMGARFAPEMEGMEISEIMDAIRHGARGKIIDVDSVESGEKVEIYVE